MVKISFLDEIVTEVSKELNIDKKQVEEICKLNIKYIHKLVRDPETISILLPGLSVLHFNLKKAKGNYKNSMTFKNFTNIIEYQIAKVEKLKEEHKDLVHSRRSYYTMLKKYFIKDRSLLKTTRKKEIFEKIEKLQNKLINEHSFK